VRDLFSEGVTSSDQDWTSTTLARRRAPGKSDFGLIGVWGAVVETGLDGDRSNSPKNNSASVVRLWSDLCRDTYVQALRTREREMNE
jgi:hypothetical protein